MNPEEILEELAAQTDELRKLAGATFEGLEDYWAICDARLSAFASEKLWALAIEVAGYDAGAEQYSLRVWLFGNCLKFVDEFVDFERTILTVPEAWNKKAEKKQVWGIARDGFSLRWRGKRFDFAPTLDDLQAARLTLSRREIESGELSPPQLLRFVSETLEHPFFLSEDALRDLLDEKAFGFKPENEFGEPIEPPLLSIDLELILQTRDWVHPKVGTGHGEDGQWQIPPRQAFETLAKTLATRDLAVWEAQDASKFNSHWSQWAEIETDQGRAQVEQIAQGKAAFREHIEKFPREEREAILEGIRPAIEASAPLVAWGDPTYLVWKGERIRIFRELLSEADALRKNLDLLAELDALNRLNE